jgi:hypothetical protein
MDNLVKVENSYGAIACEQIQIISAVIRLLVADR